MLTAAAFFLISLGTTLLAWQSNNVSGIATGRRAAAGGDGAAPGQAVAAVGFTCCLGYVAMVACDCTSADVHVAGGAARSRPAPARTRRWPTGCCAGWTSIRHDVAGTSRRCARLMLVTVFIAPAFGARRGRMDHCIGILGAGYRRRRCSRLVDRATPSAWWCLLPLVLAATRKRVERPVRAGTATRSSC